MIALSLVRVIERHSNELAVELVAKLGASPLTADMGKVPVEELRRRIEEIFRHLSDWLLAKSEPDIEKRYLEIGERRAFRLLLGDCRDQGTSLGIPAATGLQAGPR
jgi:hypothetical protein